MNEESIDYKKEVNRLKFELQARLAELEDKRAKLKESQQYAKDLENQVDNLEEERAEERNNKESVPT